MPFPQHTEPVSTDVLPRRFDLTLSGDELTALTLWASRYAPVPQGGLSVACCFLPGGRRRWLVSEANVLGWLDFSDDAQPGEGAIALPLHFLCGIETVNVLGEGAVLSFDIDAGRVAASVGDVVVRCDLPDAPDTYLPEYGRPSRYSVSHAVDVAAAVAPLRITPVEAPDPAQVNEHGVPPVPYVTLRTADGVVRFTRDWSEFDHGVIETETEAWGEPDLEVSFFSQVVLRELYVADEMEGEHVMFGLFDHAPAVMQVSGGNWGMLVETGNDIGLLFRRRIVSVLDDAGFEVEDDPYIAWNPVVSAVVGGRPVEARLVRQSKVHGSHVRVSTVVTGGVSWNPDLASEINLWNDKWFSTKLVLVGDELRVVEDVAVTNIDALPVVVTELVEKSLIVYDVVGVFM